MNQDLVERCSVRAKSSMLPLTCNDDAFAVWCDGEGVGLDEFHFGSCSVCATGIVGISRPGQCRRLTSLEIQLANYIVICAAEGKIVRRGLLQILLRHEINSMARNRVSRSLAKIYLRMAKYFMQPVVKVGKNDRTMCLNRKSERRGADCEILGFLCHRFGRLTLQSEPICRLETQQRLGET